MKALKLVLSISICLYLPVWAQIEDEKYAIESVAMEYLQAWHEGNGELMSSVVHPQMSKKIVFDTGHNNGSVAYLSVEELLIQTKRKRLQKIDAEALNKSITILDVYRNTAMVKAESQHWIDYLQMAKISGKWKIVNILWELKYGEL